MAYGFFVDGTVDVSKDIYSYIFYLLYNKQNIITKMPLYLSLKHIIFCLI